MSRVVEELTDEGWTEIFFPALEAEKDGEYTLTFRVRTPRLPKRVPDREIIRLATELYKAYMAEAYPLTAGSPYALLMQACERRAERDLYSKPKKRGAR